jgi:hypothetical protein
MKNENKELRVSNEKGALSSKSAATESFIAIFAQNDLVPAVFLSV